MARSRYSFAEHDRAHFLTCTVVEWLPVFTRQEAVQIIIDCWTHLQQHRGLKLYGYVVLENHLHVVAQADELPEVWTSFKKFTARQLIELLQQRKADTLLRRMEFVYRARRTGCHHQFWQEGSHPQAILDSEMLRQKLRYIHENPVKRGYVDQPEDWRWSSARNYAGRDGMIDVFMDWH